MTKIKRPFQPNSLNRSKFARPALRVPNPGQNGDSLALPARASVAIPFEQKLNIPSLIIFLVILGLWMAQTKTVHESWNESSRLATIQSLVEHGTWQIDASPYGHQTGDKMVIEGHYYSEKPPLFAAVGAIFYALMYYGWRATLAIEGCQPGTWCVYYWLTVLMVGVPSAFMATLFYRLALRQSDSFAWAVGLTALLCFGTVVWPYSLVFNHHLPAAIALFSSFYLLVGAEPGRLHEFYKFLLIFRAIRVIRCNSHRPVLQLRKSYISLGTVVLVAILLILEWRLKQGSNQEEDRR